MKEVLKGDDMIETDIMDIINFFERYREHQPDGRTVIVFREVTKVFREVTSVL